MQVASGGGPVQCIALDCMLNACRCSQWHAGPLVKTSLVLSGQKACMLLQASLRGAVYRSLQHTVVCWERWRCKCLRSCSASIYLQVSILTWLC